MTNNRIVSSLKKLHFADQSKHTMYSNGQSIRNEIVYNYVPRYKYLIQYFNVHTTYYNVLHIMMLMYDFFSLLQQIY